MTHADLERKWADAVDSLNAAEREIAKKHAVIVDLQHAIETNARRHKEETAGLKARLTALLADANAMKGAYSDLVANQEAHHEALIKQHNQLDQQHATLSQQHTQLLQAVEEQEAAQAELEKGREKQFEDLAQLIETLLSQQRLIVSAADAGRIHTALSTVDAAERRWHAIKAVRNGEDPPPAPDLEAATVGLGNSGGPGGMVITADLRQRMNVRIRALEEQNQLLTRRLEDVLLERKFGKVPDGPGDAPGAAGDADVFKAKVVDAEKRAAMYREKLKRQSTEATEMREVRGIYTPWSWVHMWVLVCSGVHTSKRMRGWRKHGQLSASCIQHTPLVVSLH